MRKDRFVRSRRGDFEPQLINGTLWKLGLKMSDEADDIGLTLLGVELDFVWDGTVSVGLDLFKGCDEKDGLSIVADANCLLLKIKIKDSHVEKHRVGCVCRTCGW